MRQELEDQRLRAALVTNGISNGVICETMLNVINSLGVRGNILDFGAGQGDLSRLLCQTNRFTEITAADIEKYPGAVSDPRIKWLFCDLNEKLPTGDEVFDAVVACEVIEHLENPRFLAREWFRVLKPGGALIVSTPNQESWRSILSLILAGQFVHFAGKSYPAHITALLRSDLERVFREAGFEEIAFSYTNSGAIPKLPTKSWQSISGGALRGMRFSDNIVCSAKKPL